MKHQQIPQQGLFGHLFLSVGAMKAGTTWLFQVLEKHPDLHFTPEKEIHYFYHKYVDNAQLSDRNRLTLARNRYLERFDPEKANPDRVRMNLHWVANHLSRPVDDFWFRNLFTYPRRERWACDFSNLNAHVPAEAWAHIHASCTQLRVIYTMRHPVKRLWSHVKFHKQITNRLDELRGWGPREVDRFMRVPFIWNNAEYGQVMRRLQAGLPADCLLPLYYEDMRARPREVLARIEDFLGIDHFDYPEGVLSRKVNESVDLPMPDFFPDLVAKDVARIVAELRDAGLEPPESWLR